MDTLIHKQLHMNFDDHDKIFHMLESNIAKHEHSKGFWGTTVLIELTPFDFERNQLKRGRKFSKKPKFKGECFFHIQNEKGNVVAILGYLSYYEQPNSYFFFQRDVECEKIYRFDIEKKMTSIQQNHFVDGRMVNSICLQSNSVCVSETYYYDGSNRLISIIRNHKDEMRFRDTSFFPDNTYSTEFILTYTDNDDKPNRIIWNAPRREAKQVWP